MKNRGFLKALLINLAVLLAFSSTVFTHFLLNDDISRTIATIVKQIIFTIICVIICKKVFHLPSPFTKKRLFYGLFVAGSIVWVYIIGNFILSYVPPTKPLSEGFKLLPLLLFGNFTTGLCEETMCRVLGFEVLRKHLTDDRKGVFSAALLSSALFGILHLLNLISGQPLIQTLAQVGYAFVFGMCFSAIYYKSGNVIPCIILHALVNFAGGVWSLFYEPSSGDMTIGGAIFLLVEFLPMLIYSLLIFFGVFDKLGNKRKTKQL